MTEPESYAGLHDTLIEAEIHAGELQEQGHETKIEEGMHHLGKWTVYATGDE